MTSYVGHIFGSIFDRFSFPCCTLLNLKNRALQRAHDLSNNPLRKWHRFFFSLPTCLHLVTFSHTCMQLSQLLVVLFTFAVSTEPLSFLEDAVLSNWQARSSFDRSRRLASFCRAWRIAALRAVVLIIM